MLYQIFKSKVYNNFYMNNQLLMQNISLDLFIFIYVFDYIGF